MKKEMNVWQRLQRNQTAFILLVLCCLLGGCSARAGAPKSKVETANAEAASASQQRGAVQDGFPFPQIPAVLTSPEERRSYLLAHYWDEYDFADTVLLHKAEVTEQGLVNYIDLVVSHPDAEEAAGTVDAFCRAVALSDEARKTMPTLLEKYLYDPMSPMRNDMLYVQFLNGLLAHAPAADARRDRWTFLRDLAGRNNPGQRAEDFTFYLPDGTRRTLYGMPSQKLLLLFFYDPECENCHATLLAMKSSEVLAQAVQSGQVAVLAVYTEGNPEVWRARLDEMPQDWTVGTDRELIKRKSLYDLKAMPSLYLLDASKQVLMKDASLEEILAGL